MRLPTQLLRRKADAQKYDFGHIFILGGSARYSGAVVLAGNAAMRCGAGLVTLGIPEGLNPAIIKIKFKEVMTLPLAQIKLGELSLSAYRQVKDFLKTADVLAVGPGLGRQDSTQKLIRKFILKADKPIVIDADGLNALAGYLKILPAASGQRPATILTPHPGEMARILGIGVKKVQANRKKIAQEFARNYKVTLVLKGHQTVVADSRGSFYVNKTGNAGMATAGTGDVLTGMIAAFLGQGLDAFSAAKYAVYLHGLAGDLAAKEKTQISLIASDIIDKIPEVIKRSS